MWDLVLKILELTGTNNFLLILLSSFNLYLIHTLLTKVINELKQIREQIKTISLKLEEGNVRRKKKEMAKSTEVMV